MWILFLSKMETTEILEKLRNTFKESKYVGEPIQAYFVPDGDPHQVIKKKILAINKYVFIKYEFYTNAGFSKKFIKQHNFFLTWRNDFFEYYFKGLTYKSSDLILSET